MPYGDLLKFNGRLMTLNPNPCIRAYGVGPEGARCKDCQFLHAIAYARTYYKCSLRLNTGGAATDHRMNWNACGKYQMKVNGKERNTR